MLTFITQLIFLFGFVHSLKQKSMVRFESTPLTYDLAQTYLKLPGFQMLNSEKQYLCYIPESNTTENFGQTQSQASDDLLKAQAMSIVEKSFPTDKCIYSRPINDYWTYGYCFGDKIIQFHNDEKHFLTKNQFKPHNPDHVFVLGRFTDDGPKKTEIRNQSKWKSDQKNLQESDFSITLDNIGNSVDYTAPYDNLGNTVERTATIDKSVSYSKMLQHYLKAGEVCEPTGSFRSLDVVYKCHDPQNEKLSILSVQELYFCQYIMFIHVPGLCKIPEFQPTTLQEEILEISCRQVIPQITNELINKQNISNTSFVEPQKLYPLDNNQTFPIDHYHKIPLIEYRLSSFGDGFYLAIAKEPVNSQHNYFDHRFVFITCDDFETVEELLDKFGKMFMKSLEAKLLAPVPGEQQLLKWEDTFVMWFELYNFKGEFMNMIKIYRDGTNPNYEIQLQYVDPVTMNDHMGNHVEIGSYDAPENAVNFQNYFQSNVAKDSTSN